MGEVSHVACGRTDEKQTLQWSIDFLSGWTDSRRQRRETTNMKFIACAFACAIALAGAGPARGQEQTINDYVRQLVMDSSDPAQEVLVGDIVIAEMGEFGVYEVEFRLDPDKQYYLYAACDDDCGDIDLVGYDADGDEVDSDAEDDPNPLLLVMPGDAGDSLRVELDMELCSADVCVFGIGLYEVVD